MNRFELYQSAGQWRWRFVAANNRIIAVSSEGYWNRSDCTASIRLVKTFGPGATVYDVSQSPATVVAV
jgi:uncharacterized protein YegP (UPF0339 family)